MIRPFIGARPRFEKDGDFPPLQAADLLAWWIRRWESGGDFDIPGYSLRFPWGAQRKMHHVHIRYRQHELREDLNML
jgi:hypothetical protein